MKSNTLWLGIESSCDDTACAVLLEKEDSIEILSNCLYSQIDEHKAWGGVVPELASRAHLEKIVPVLEESLAKANVKIKDINKIAYTRCPGLMGSLLVGANFAQGLARDLEIECYGVNHLEGHIYSALFSNGELRMENGECFLTPAGNSEFKDERLQIDNSQFSILHSQFIALLVSGGHTELVLCNPNFEYVSIGKTRDDAAGEAFDKSGKILGLGYPAGKEISNLAKSGDKKFYDFPRALNDSSFEFSFSGFKTAVSRYVKEHSEDFIKEHLADICASLQEAIADILTVKAVKAAKKFNVENIVLCGGVSANYRIRELLKERAENCIFPEPSLSTDNGAMIAAAAILRSRAGKLAQCDEVKAWNELW